jgi:tRNA A-37 threonylcarbamoyl transferase component Bud32
MTPERWQQIKAVLAEAMEQPTGERDSFIERASGADTDLEREVRSLLAVAQSTGEGSITSHFVPSADRALQAILATALGQQYEIVRPLGQGGMGAVYLARERALDRFVAIKVLRPELADTEASRERFRREARIAAQLSHPNILPLHTFGEVNGIWYFVMGYVRGVTLGERLRVEGRLPSEEAQRILIELTGALEHAHSHGVIHRDIKPANVLLDEQTGRAMLADFGISKVHGAADSLTGTGVIIGTPHYMSPEQSLGAPTVDERSDIYSLGAVAYTMLAGREPFADSKPNEMVFRRLSEDPLPVATLAPSVDPELAAIVMRCLAREPAGRWQRARDLRDALVRLTGDALATIPESLRDLPSFGPYALIWAAVWTTIAFRGERGLDDRVLLLLIAVAVPFGFLVHIWNVGRPDLGWSGIGRVAFWPPDWWGMWWPRGLRRPTDLWKRLPWQARAVRSGLSVFMIVLPVMILLRPEIERAGGAAARARFGDVQTLLIIGAAATIVFGLVWAYRLRLSWSDTARLLVGATTPSSGWSSPDIAPMLAPVKGRTRGPLRDTAAEHRRAIMDALPTLPAAASAVTQQLSSAVRRLHDEIDAYDAEIAALERDAGPAEVERLSTRLAALNADPSSTPARRELVDLVRRELEVVRELRVACEIVSQRRAHLYAVMRGLWTQVSIVRDQAAETSSASHPAIARLVELSEEVQRELDAQADPANSRLSQARAVAHSRLTVAGEISSASAASSTLKPPK